MHLGDDMRIDKLIKHMRLTCGLEQKELGRLIGKSESTISLYESGGIAVSMETFVKIAEICEFEVFIKDENSDETIAIEKKDI